MLSLTFSTSSLRDGTPYAPGSDAGYYWINVDWSVVPKNYFPTYVSTYIEVNPRPVTVSGITAADKEYDGTTDAILNCENVTLEGKLDGDELTVTGTGTFKDRNVGNEKTVTISGLTLGGSAAGNYCLAKSGQQRSTTARIYVRTLDISGITAYDKEYDGTKDAVPCYVDMKVERHGGGVGLIEGDSVKVTAMARFDDA